MSIEEDIDKLLNRVNVGDMFSYSEYLLLETAILFLLNEHNTKRLEFSKDTIEQYTRLLHKVRVLQE